MFGAGSVDVVALFIGMVTTHLRNDYMHYSLINYTGLKAQFALWERRT